MVRDIIKTSRNGAINTAPALTKMPVERQAMAKSTIRKSYKFRIRRPSTAIELKLTQTLDVCREIYNAALQERRDAWRLNRVSIAYYDQQNQLPEIRKIRPDVASVHAHVLRNPLARLDKAFQDFFRRVKAKQKAGFPRFKGANQFNSFTYTDGFSVKGSVLTLSKIGALRLRLPRRFSNRF